MQIQWNAFINIHTDSNFRFCTPAEAQPCHCRLEVLQKLVRLLVYLNNVAIDANAPIVVAAAAVAFFSLLFSCFYINDISLFPRCPEQTRGCYVRRSAKIPFGMLVAEKAPMIQNKSRR